MSARALHRHWSRRLETLQSRTATLYADCRTTGSAESIHDLRVAIRRVRLYARVGRPLLRRGSVRRFDEWSRTVNDLLGPIRDCDVCLNWLAAFPDSTDVIQVVHDERVRLLRLAFESLHSKRHAKPVLIRIRKGGRDRMEKLEARFDKMLRKISQSVIDAVPQSGGMNPLELHNLRRQLRRWRYLRELSLPARMHRKDSGLVWLNTVQDALGESQNLQMASELATALLDPFQRAKWIGQARAEQKRWTAQARKALARLPRQLARSV